MAKFSMDMVAELLQDPYPYIRHLRETEPVAFIEDFEIWLVTTYSEVEAVLLDLDRQFSVEFHRFAFRPPDLPPASPAQQRTATALEHILMHKDPPEHTRLRKLHREAFTRRNVQALRGKIDEIVEGLLDRAAEKGKIDFVADIAVPIPIVVMAEFLGVPAEDAGDFQRWVDDSLMRLDISKPPELRAQALAGVTEMHEYFDDVFKKRARDPKDDIISAFAADELSIKPTEAESFGAFVSLMIAGTETTRHLMGNAIVALQRHPDQRKLLIENPDILPQAIEEILRFDTPVMMTAARTPIEDIEFAGVKIRAGERVIPSPGAANRDPEFFSDPETLDFTRTNSSSARSSRIDHLSFGAGAHVCIGPALARLEAQCALRGFLARFPDFEADVAGPLDYQPTLFIRGLNSLQVDLGT